IAAVKFAPFRKSERANATEAYEQEEDAAPRPVATARLCGESSGSKRRSSRLETTAWTTPDSANPRMSAHRTSHVMPRAKLAARHSSCPTATAPTIGLQRVFANRWTAAKSSAVFVSASLLSPAARASATQWVT